MKRICILGMCMLTLLTASMFAGCNNQDSGKQTANTSSSDTVNKSDLKLVEGQSSNIDIDEDNINDPFSK